METTNKRRENLTWPDEDKTRKQLEAIRELAKELRTDYPTDTPQIWGSVRNQRLNRRNALIRAQFSTDDTVWHLINGAEWLELFDLIGFSVDRETRKRFASHLKWYSFWYADFKPRLSSKYAQRIHWYVYNFLFCLRNKLQTEKDYREGKYGSKRQSYFVEIEEQPATHTETPQISTETAETTELSAEVTKAEEAPKYSISERDGNVYVTFKRGVIRQCAKRCGVSCKSAEWNTIAQAYNGTHSDMGMGLSFFFYGREDAVRFAELVCNGDISGYYKLYMDKIIAEGEARKKRIAEKCAEYDAAQAYFAECMADEDAETVNVSAEGENAAERPQYRVWRFTKPNYAQIIVSDYSQWKVVAVLSFVWGKTQIEVSDDVANIHTIGKKELTIDKSLTELTDAEVLELIYNHTEPPQSPETPQPVECIADTPKPRETARKPQNRGIGSAQATRRNTSSDTLHPVTCVPRECSTADAAYW